MHAFFRACKKASYIPKIAGGPAQKKDKQRLKDEISKALKDMDHVNRSIQDRQATADMEMKECLQQIDDNTEKLIKHAQTLKKAAVTDVVDRHKNTTNGLQSEMKSVVDVTAKMKMRMKNLNNTSLISDSQTFVDIKQGKKELEDARHLEQRLKTSGSWQGKTTFAVEDLVGIFLNDVDSLGKIITLRPKPYKAVLKGTFNVSLEDDEETCFIHDICVFADGKTLLTDFYNMRIKVLDQSNKVSKSFKLSSGPWGICQTSAGTVAVTLLDDRKVQFVNIVGQWKLTRSFKVDDGCRGISHGNGELLISCGGHPGTENYDPEGPGFVGIYDMSGSLRRKIQLDSNGRQIFSVPYHIATTNDGGKIHIADKEGGIITVNSRGNVLSTFNDNIEWAAGVCAISDDSLIACGSDSDNVLQIDTSGNMVGELLSKRNGIDDPFVVSFCSSSSVPRLIVASFTSDEIIMFDLISI